MLESLTSACIVVFMLATHNNFSYTDNLYLLTLGYNFDTTKKR